MFGRVSLILSLMLAAALACKDSEFGCCSDGQTEALGPDGEGCPELVTDGDGSGSEEGEEQPKPGVCGLPADQGPCLAAMPRWYFNSNSGECEVFLYGGCLGNANNFATKVRCQNICDRDICVQKPNKGVCRAIIPRWYYNPSKNMCEVFVYGGCLGNDNNFKTMSDCADRCMITPAYPKGPAPTPVRPSADELLLAARRRVALQRAALYMYAKGSYMPVYYPKGSPVLPASKGMLAAAMCRDKLVSCPMMAKYGMCGGSVTVRSMCCRSCVLAMTSTKGA